MTTPTNQSDAIGTNPQVGYSESGRSGTIHYTSTETCFDMWYELAMPPAIAIIGIPEPQYWESQTKTPSSQRIPILEFIGTRVINDKIGGEGYIEIEQDNIMTIYRGRKPDASKKRDRH